MLALSLEREHIAAPVELIGFLIGEPEPFEERVRSHDELELGGPNPVADHEHTIFKANLGDSAEVKHSAKIVPVRHTRSPFFEWAERTNVSLHRVNGSTTDAIDPRLAIAVPA